MIECSVCLESRDLYYTLGCSHEFCAECVVNLIHHDTFDACPLCRTPITSVSNLTDEDLSQLKILVKSIGRNGSDEGSHGAVLPAETTVLEEVARPDLQPTVWEYVDPVQDSPRTMRPRVDVVVTPLYRSNSEDPQECAADICCWVCATIIVVYFIFIH